MVIAPKTKGFICTTAHPVGCEANVAEWINYIKAQKSLSKLENVLVIGSSAGYGLASRIAAAWGCSAKTLGVSYDKNAANGRTATAGFYNTAAFHKFAVRDGLYAKTVMGDAFSPEIKQKAIDIIRSDMGQLDMVIYSLAAPSRTDYATGQRYSSVLKTVSEPYTNRSIDMSTGKMVDVTIQPASQAEIDATVKVMGGEDWQDWITALRECNLLKSDAVTLAYSYIGPELTYPIYREGSIGMAKNHLKRTADTMQGARAYVSVNKAVVTQASSAIPVVPLYISILFDIMKKQGNHEGCIEQIYRMIERLNTANPTDENGYIRMDDLEMLPSVQEEVTRRWNAVTDDNLCELADVPGYRREFMRLFGFEADGVDYNAEVNETADETGIII